MKIIDITNNDIDLYVKNGNVLVDFYADWCGPCKMMSPIVDELSKETDVKVVKINVDDSPEIAQKYGIMSIPTFIVFKDGEEYKKHIGMCEKDYLLELIK